MTISKDDHGNPLNITDFAKKLGVSRSAISEVESFKREPSKTVIKKVVEIYGINILNKISVEQKSDIGKEIHIKVNLQMAEEEIAKLKQEVERLKEEKSQLYLKILLLEDKIEDLSPPSDPHF